MSRYIYITDDCLMDIAYEHMDDNALIGLQNALEKIPTADVVEIKHGKWVVKGQEVYCSKCKKTSGYNWHGASAFSKFCPNCGARMEVQI